MQRGLLAALTFLLLLAAISSFAAESTEAIPYLKKIQSCNPALGSDCAVPAAQRMTSCATDSDCGMGCLKDDDTWTLPHCLPTTKIAKSCGAANAVMQPGVACGCMPDSHTCGYIPLPPK